MGCVHSGISMHGPGVNAADMDGHFLYLRSLLQAECLCGWICPLMACTSHGMSCLTSRCQQSSLSEICSPGVTVMNCQVISGSHTESCHIQLPH